MKLQNYLAGQWIEGSGEGQALVDPTTGETLATADTTGVDFAGALAHARKAGGTDLRALSYAARAGLLGRIADTLVANRDAYVDIAQKNSGNTKIDAAIDIDGAIGTLKVYAKLGQGLGDAGHLVDGDLIRLGKDPKFQALHIATPRRGAAIHINAFNFPAWGLWEKAAVALLSGMPVVAKPATSTCWLSNRMVHDVVAADILPDGALSLICGSVGDLLDHVTGQDVIAFTGSADTGARIRGHQAVVANNVPVNIEADSLNACVLGPDVTPDSPEFDLFVKEVAREMTQKAGQKCTAIRRVLVPAAVEDAVVDALAARLGKVTVGDPRNEATRMGPLVNKAQQKAALDGLKALAGETQQVTDPAVTPLDGDAKTGAFVGPTLLRCADPDGAEKVHEIEVFGPVATVMAYRDLDHAAALAARGGGSLVTSIFTADGDTADQAVLAMAPYHGRLMVIDAQVADASTGHGIVMPTCLHGGPGRAGGGAELGGLRGLSFYHQTTAVQGPHDRLRALADAGGKLA